MAFRVEITAGARKDANAILFWLSSKQAGETGIRWYERLEEAVASLAQSPERCALAPENAHVPFELRQLVYGHRPHLYRILFTVDGEAVYVLHIRHGRRRPVAQM
jgi:plasmid stabilization system protein ParE